jgi:hypothetical protein
LVGVGSRKYSEIGADPARHHRRDLVTYGDATLIIGGLIEYTTAGSNVVSNRMPAGFPTF